jgi:hypothetical protein
MLPTDNQGFGFACPCLSYIITLLEVDIYWISAGRLSVKKQFLLEINKSVLKVSSIDESDIFSHSRNSLEVDRQSAQSWQSQSCWSFSTFEQHRPMHLL